jgi:TRAP-type C4-dicarboxylate transport system permease small subunit
VSERPSDPPPGILYQIASRSLFVLGGVLMIAITLVVIYTVFMRYFLSAPPAWGEALALLLFAWLSFTGAAHATITGGNISVEVVLRSFPRTVQRVLLSFYSLLSIVFLVLVAWKGIPLFMVGLNRTIFGLGISTSWTSGGLFVALGLMILGQVRWFWLQAVQGRIDPPKPEHRTLE